MEITLIAAMDEEGGIGKDNAIPWNNPADMRRFARATMCNPIIMGRKTFESIGRVLGGRLNIVVTSHPETCAGVLTAKSLEDALSALRASGAMFEQVYVIGGAQIYQEALSKGLVDRIELSVVPGKFNCDTFLPDIPALYVPMFDCPISDGLDTFHLRVLERAE